MFVNKNAIKSNFGNYANKVGNLQIVWERLQEFGRWAWEFLQFGSSHTAGPSRACAYSALEGEMKSPNRGLLRTQESKAFLTFLRSWPFPVQKVSSRTVFVSAVII